MRKILIVLALVSSLLSCERRPIYEEGKTAIPVIVLTDWAYLGGPPTGATIRFYPEDGSAPYQFKTNDVTSARVNVPSGNYTVLVFNRTQEELKGTLGFKEMEGLGTARAYLAYKYSAWTGRDDTVEQPEAIVCGRTDHFCVRELTTGEALITSPDTCKVTPKRMIYECTVNVHVQGIDNTYDDGSGVRAFLTGMAREMYLATRSASEVTSTTVLDDWKIARNETDYTKGTFSATFEGFGLPDGHAGTSSDNYFYIQVALKDGKTVLNFEYNVGDLIVQNKDEHILTLDIGLETRVGDDPIVLPDVEHESEQKSGFDVSFEDWGEPEDVVVPM